MTFKADEGSAPAPRILIEHSDHWLINMGDLAMMDVTLSRIQVHMIAETHLHAGHADYVRELVDGSHHGASVCGVVAGGAAGALGLAQARSRRASRSWAASASLPGMRWP